MSENKRVAKLIGINPAARSTTIKPSGCVTPETKIITNKGLLSLDEIFKINDYNIEDFKNKSNLFLEVKEDIMVKDMNNEYQYINKLYVNGMSDTYNIEFEDGMIVICTPNHKFLNADGNWVSADELVLDNNIKNITKNTEQKFTVDIEVDNTSSYQLENKTVVHNTSSLVLGTSSGIHAWHDRYYIRRIRVGKNEAIYKYLIKKHPELVEDDYFKPHIQAVISVPQEAPMGAHFRDETALDLLERTKRFNLEWVANGHIKGSNKNNVSVTVSIKDDEWDSVGKWMWDNKDSYNGVSVLNYDNGSYIQAPFESITKEKYLEMMEHLKDLDITKIREDDDNTDLQSEAACAGGACEII